MSVLVTVEDIAKRFNVHPETVRKWVRQGRLPCLRPTKCTIRFKVEEVDRALERQVSHEH